MGEGGGRKAGQDRDMQHGREYGDMNEKGEKGEGRDTGKGGGEYEQDDPTGIMSLGALTGSASRRRGKGGRLRKDPI